MAYSPGSRVPYFSNPDVIVSFEPTGLADTRDNARTLNETQFLVGDFRDGAGDGFDCDGSGVSDAIEIALGLSRDDNRNGFPDTCDIAFGLTDCNANGILDTYEARPWHEFSTGPLSGFDGGSVLQTSLSGLPEASGELEVEIVGYGDLNTSAEFVTVQLGGGDVLDEVVFSRTGGSDCFAPRVSQTFSLDAQAFNAAMLGGLAVRLEASDDVGADVCNLGNQVTLRFTYRTFDDSVDADRDGVPDDCGGACSVADLGEPFGQLDIADAVAFLQLFGANDPAADLAAPFGTTDIADMVAFLQIFGAGCP